MADHVDVLAAVPAFAGFSADLLRRLSDRCVPTALPAGAWLFRQGDEGDGMYVVRSGRLELVRDMPGPPTPVGVLGPGEALGELSLLLGAPRSLSAEAIRDTELLRLDRTDVLDLLNDDLEFAAGLTRVVAGFLQDRALSRGVADVHGTVLTIVSLHPDASIAALRDAMAEIPARRRVVVLDGSAGSAHSDFGGMLDQAEREHDRVFLLAGAPDAPEQWNEFCLRQADRVIALVPPAAPLPKPGERPELDGCDLVFWTSPSRVPAVGQWLDRMRPRSHHFVDPNELGTTLPRALRRLAGLSVGVVLSSGGARTLAHIGVLQGLCDAGVAVDRVGGSSFGALVGGMFALGMAPKEIEARLRREFVSNWPFNDYTVPRVSLLRGRKLRSALDRVFGSERIEQAPIDFFAVSADLLSSTLVVHRTGLFTEALAASLAMPGMLPPVRKGDRVLIDGSALNDLPIDVMAATGEGPVIAVDVVGGRLKIRRGHNLPPIVETISRSAVIGGWAAAASSRGRARLLIQPEAAAAGQLEFGRINELVEAGRRAASEALASAGDLLDGMVAHQSGGIGG